MESILGLPAHPLFVHAPVVLMPLATLATLILAFRPAWRRRLGFTLPVAAILILGMTQLAIASGDAFSELIPVNVDDHEALALMTRNFIGLFVVSSLLLALFDRWHGKGGPAWLGSGVLLMVVVTTISSILATVWMARTGDAGARLVWNNIITIWPLG